MTLLAAATLLAADLPAQGIHLPPRGSMSGRVGFSPLYASQGEGNIFFGARLSWGGGLQLRLLPGPHPGFDARAVDAAVAIILARDPLKRRRSETRAPAARPPEETPSPPPDTPRSRDPI